MNAPPLPANSRYELLLRLAAGGTATVYLGRRRGGAGFSRLVAVKRAHHHLIEDPSFHGALLREARIASQLRHPNVVPIVDVEEVGGELLLIMDYVEGASLAALAAPGGGDALGRARAALRVMVDACAGLDAAHRALDERGRPLGLVHRDVSPQNILVGVDGVGRLIDFGIAKVSSLRSGHTGLSLLKGKVPYMAPEYLRGEPLDARSDVFGAGVVLWEALTGRRLFRAANEFDTLKRILELEAPPPSSFLPALPAALDRALGRALAKSPAARYESARAFGEALEAGAREAGLLATHAEVGELVAERAGEAVGKVREAVRALAGAPPDDDGPSLLIEIEAGPEREGPGVGGESRERETLTASPARLPDAAGAPPARLPDAAGAPLAQAPHPGEGPAPSPDPADVSAAPAALSTTTSELADALRPRAPTRRARALAAGAALFALGAAFVALGRAPGGATPASSREGAPAFVAADAPPVVAADAPPVVAAGGGPSAGAKGDGPSAATAGEGAGADARGAPPAGGPDVVDVRSLPPAPPARAAPPPPRAFAPPPRPGGARPPARVSTEKRNSPPPPAANPYRSAR